MIFNSVGNFILGLTLFLLISFRGKRVFVRTQNIAMDIRKIFLESNWSNDWPRKSQQQALNITYSLRRQFQNIDYINIITWIIKASDEQRIAYTAFELSPLSCTYIREKLSRVQLTQLNSLSALVECIGSRIVRSSTLRIVKAFLCKIKSIDQPYL